jgi:putative heme-binding domain-containing protein
MPIGCCIALLALAPLVASADGPNVDPLPKWIWTPERGTTGKLLFAKTFDLNEVPQQAELHIAADFCSVSVTLNGESVLSLEDYSPITRLDVTQFVVPGENSIQVAAIASEGPSAVALSLGLTLPDGRQIHVPSDETWQLEGGRKRNARTLGDVSPEMWGIGARSIQISPFDNYEQWRQALGAEPGSERYWTAPGFEIELVRAAAADEGSWVALAFDPRGRVTVAREDRGLLRMTFDAPGGAVNAVEMIDDTLLECRGLLYVGDDLYANANNSKNTYRLRDADEDGRLDEPTMLREFPGTVGHGRNQLAAGPDGRIYSICGDAVELPTGLLDRTSPIRQHTRPAGALEGFVVAFDPDTEDWELCSAGTRNPFGIAFNRDGEAFTYDADAEFDTGAPWYRPTRLLHLVSGADYGWRSVTGQWPPYDPDRPDNALPVLDIGKGSPTAVGFGYESRFPLRYREALYILDWAYGRVLAVHLRPRGAGYVAEAEMFLQGLPLNVCGLDFGPDGAMYLVTGGRGTKSGLYRVRWTGDDAAADTNSDAEDTATQLADHDSLVAEFSAKQRQARRQMEQFHGRQDPEAIAAAWPHLDSPDPVLRYAARTAVEHQPVETWKDRAFGERRITASLTALMALARAADGFDVDAIIERAGRWNFGQLTTSQQLTLLHIYELCLQTDPASFGRQREVVVRHLEGRFPVEYGSTLAVSPMGDGARVNRELARLLVALEAPTALEKCLALLEASSSQPDRLHYLFLLRDVRDGWSIDGHRAYFTALQGTSHFQGGDGMPGFLQATREAATARLNDEERAALASLLEPTVPDSQASTVNRPIVQQWTLDALADTPALDPSAGDPDRGADVFRDALCTRCHRVGATGPAVGPDLTYVGRRFTRRDMLQSVLTPSQVVAENYRNMEVVTTDGRVITGRPVLSGDYRLPVLRIATNPLQPAQVEEVPKDQVELHRLAESSPMPAGLLNGFTPDEIADLLAYLQRGQLTGGGQ